MDNAKSQLVEKLKGSTNILVTVSRNPTVDQLAACVGMTLLLNKLGKHATAVFSGEVPSTLEFLQPEQTLEKTTDSLRDFIIALDKTKADKLRYKVEDDMVRIFITPYRVSISDKDLEFSQGDFNVDVVIALGVSQQEDFDEAITAHGRILHDAVVGSLSIRGGVELGGINWADGSASSLSEMVVSLVGELGDDLLDQQVATALLTGIVSETERFSNEKTTPQTMSVSAQLMNAGANQQLVASKLQEPLVEKQEPAAQDKTGEAPISEPEATEEPKKSADGTLEIEHEHDSLDAVLQGLHESEAELPKPVLDEKPDVDSSAEENHPAEKEPELKEEHVSSLEDNSPSRLIVDPPSLGGRLTANTQPEQLDPANDILGVTAQQPQPLLSRTPIPEPKKPKTPINQTMAGFTPPPPSWVPSDPSQHTPGTAQTLSEIEAAVHAVKPATLNDARDEVSKALNSQPPVPQPVQALGAQPLGEPLRPVDTVEAAVSPNPNFSEVLSQVIPPAPAAPAPENLPVPPTGLVPPPVANDPTAPPPVPPPIPYNFGNQQPPSQQ